MSAIDSAFVRYCRKELEHNGAVHQIFIDYENAYDTMIREVL